MEQINIFDVLLDMQPRKKDEVQRKKEIKLLSLFSGIGAFEKALDRLGIPFELIGFCEVDKYASKSYSVIHNVPESKNLGDITKVDEKALQTDIDLITYGFPCQDISCSGLMKGLFNEDGSQTRSGLFFEALRIIAATKPKIALAENVKNLVSKKFNAQFQVVLTSLEHAGYNNYFQVLNAKDYGVPQNRERVFIVSIRKDIDTGLFEFPKPFPLKNLLKDAVEKEVDEKFYLHYNQANVSGQKVNYIAAAIRGRADKNGITHQRLEVSEREYANAITTVQKDSLIGEIIDCGDQNRCLRVRYPTPKECFRLMGFDDADFEKAEAVNKKTNLYKQAGNSIAVPVVEYIIKALRHCCAL